MEDNTAAFDEAAFGGQASADPVGDAPPAIGTPDMPGPNRSPTPDDDLFGSMSSPY